MAPAEAKAAGSGAGVDWVGNSGATRLMWMQSGAVPNAEELTRHIALATSAYCFRACEYRWTTIAEPPLGVIEPTDDGTEILTDHPLAFLLDEPSPDFDMGELQSLTEAYRLITGAALWTKGEGDDTAQLLPYSGDQFSTEAFNGRIFGKFHVDTAQGRRTYLPDEVVFFREINPNSWRTNLSKVDVALGLLNQGHQVNRTVSNFLRNAMSPGGVISPSADWNPDDDEFEQYTDSIKAWHAGPGNAGEPLVLLGGTAFSATALPLKGLLPSELLDRIEATVAAVFGIPPVVLGWLVGLKNSPWSQMSEARRMTYEDTIEPRWVDIQNRMTRQMLDPGDRAAGRSIAFDLREVRALQHDDQARATTSATNKDIWTNNERRQYTGQEPWEDERGDEVGTGGGGGGEFGGVEGMADPGPPAFKYANNPKGLAWVLFDANCKASEPVWEREIYKQLQAQQKELDRLAKKYLKEEKAATENSAQLFLSKWDEWLMETGIPNLLVAAFPLVFSTAKAGVKQAAAKVNVAFDLLQEGLADYAEREAIFLAEVMGETSGAAVASAVRKSLETGELLGDLTKRLETLPAFDRPRAKLTARTETTRAWNGAQREMLSEYQASSGRQVFKTWLSAQDDRVRDEHIELDGDQLPIDAVFDNGLTEPGEPNCRCTLIYSIADNSGE